MCCSARCLFFFFPSWLRNKDEYIRLCEQNCLKSVSAEKLYAPPSATATTAAAAAAASSGGSNASAASIAHNAADRTSAIVFEKARPAHEEAYRRIVREDKEKVREQEKKKNNLTGDHGAHGVNSRVSKCVLTAVLARPLLSLCFVLLCACQGIAGSSYLDWFVDGVYKLDNQLGPAPASLPPSSYEPPPAPAPITLGSVGATAGAQLLGMMSPISPVVQMREAEEAAAAARAAAAMPQEDDESVMTVATLASIT